MFNFLAVEVGAEVGRKGLSQRQVDLTGGLQLQVLLEVTQEAEAFMDRPGEMRVIVVLGLAVG